jgi:tRNA threonylcarbamoyladenosine biosynthesis protein TsaB
MPTLLAFDTATETMSIALRVGAAVSAHESAGGAMASANLIPNIMALLAQAGVTLRDLDAIAFGRGPGAFTGLRTACSVAQGLALGAGKPVLPVDSLLAVAEDARDGDAAQRIWVLMDARMDEIYAAHYTFDAGRWTTLAAPMLTTPSLLADLWRDDPPEAVAGSALGAFGDALDTGAARRVPAALPRARAMLALADALWHSGGAVDAALALPLYVRDKVAQTTAERDATRLAKLAATTEDAQ